MSLPQQVANTVALVSDPSAACIETTTNFVLVNGVANFTLPLRRPVSYANRAFNIFRNGLGGCYDVCVSLAAD